MAPDTNGGMAPIGRMSPLEGPGKVGKGKANAPADGADFRQFLKENLEKVNQMQLDADEAVHGLMTGRETDITKVMGAVEKADVAFQTLMAVRNKMVESYQEILRMRI